MNNAFKRSIAARMLTMAIEGHSYTHLSKLFRVPRTTVRRWTKYAYRYATSKPSLNLVQARKQHRYDLHFEKCLQNWVLTGLPQPYGSDYGALLNLLGRAVAWINDGLTGVHKKLARILT